MANTKSITGIMTDGMIKIVADHVSRGKEKTFDLLKRLGSVREQFETCYLLLVSDPIKPMMRIEQCAAKLEYWTQVRKLALPEREKIKIAHALYLIDVILLPETIENER